MPEQVSVSQQEVEYLLQRLFPICRSITGDGVRQTLNIIREYAPEFQVHEYSSGTQVFDWNIPKEWNIQDAYIKDGQGERIVDFQESNVHVVSYSKAVHEKISFSKLKAKLHTLEALPEAIPYRTSYYKEDWGFCVNRAQYTRLSQNENEEYEVHIDSELKNGALTLADALLKGSDGGDKKKRENYLISTYCCHPSLANDNLSGLVLTILLFNELKTKKLRHNYRFVIVPETIGAIVYLAHHQEAMKNIDGGLVITTVAGPGKHGYKQTFLGEHKMDHAIRQAFYECGVDYTEYPFVPNGSDERQYSSPGFRIPVASITKDKYYEYEYYHTSLDNLDFIKSDYLLETLRLYLRVIEILEMDRSYRSLFPNGEVQLGKRGLYPDIGGIQHQPSVLSKKQELREINEIDALSWLLFLSDGKHTLLEVAKKSRASIRQLNALAIKLLDKGILEEIE